MARAALGHRWVAGCLGIGAAGRGVEHTVGQSQAIESTEGAPIAQYRGHSPPAQDARFHRCGGSRTSKDLNQHLHPCRQEKRRRIVGRESTGQTSGVSTRYLASQLAAASPGTRGTKRKASRSWALRVRFPDPRFRPGRRLAMGGGAAAGAWPAASAGPLPGNASTPGFTPPGPGPLKRGQRLSRQFLTAIGPRHQLDGHFLYQERVSGPGAEARLSSQPNDDEALLELALLARFRNAPSTAGTAGSGPPRGAPPTNPWPSAYRSGCALAGWIRDPCRGRQGGCQGRHAAAPAVLEASPISPEPSAADPRGLRELPLAADRHLKR